MPAPTRAPSQNHASALEYLYGRINYERTPPKSRSSRSLNLERMRDLLRRVGDPHLEVPVVHVAGTKGKIAIHALHFPASGVDKNDFICMSVTVKKVTAVLRARGVHGTAVIRRIHTTDPGRRSRVAHVREGKSRVYGNRIVED